MDTNDKKITLYVSQSKEIVTRLEQGESHFVKMSYVQEKYQEVAEVFTEVYKWYVREAGEIVAKPKEAESAVWAYASLKQIDQNFGFEILELSVPIDEVILFKMDDWSRRINCQYIGKNNEENCEFLKEINKIGAKEEADIYQTDFYPIQKRKLVASWNNLFINSSCLKEKVLKGEDLLNIQGGLWTILPKWIVKNHTK